MALPDVIGTAARERLGLNMPIYRPHARRGLLVEGARAGGCAEELGVAMISSESSIQMDRKSTLKATYSGSHRLLEGFTLRMATFKGNVMRGEGIQAVPDLGLFQGALLLLSGYQDGQPTNSVGSAILIGPGVALTATHVLDELQSPTSGVEAIAINSDEILWWHGVHAATRVTLDRVTGEERSPFDIAALALDLHSDPGPTLSLRLPVIETNPPAVGDMVTVAGYRATEGSNPLELQLLISRGPISAVYPDGRDASMLPNPCAEVDLDCHGGMSGGPVFNDRGNLIGVISTSVHADGIARPAFISLIHPSVALNVRPGWPPNFYPEGDLTVGGIIEALSKFQARATFGNFDLGS